MNALLRSVTRSRPPYGSRMALTLKDFHAGAPVATFNVRKVELTPLEQRKLTFDSHAMVKELESSGFEKSQAELITSALVTLTIANMDIVYKDMVTSSHQEIALQQIMAHLDSIRKDMVILEKSEFSNLRSENEKMKREMDQLKNRLTEESRKIRAEAKLDINLERSRISDMFPVNLLVYRTGEEADGDDHRVSQEESRHRPRQHGGQQEDGLGGGLAKNPPGVSEAGDHSLPRSVCVYLPGHRLGLLPSMEVTILPVRKNEQRSSLKERGGKICNSS